MEMTKEEMEIEAEQENLTTQVDIETPEQDIFDDFISDSTQTKNLTRYPQKNYAKRQALGSTPVTFSPWNYYYYQWCLYTSQLLKLVNCILSLFFVKRLNASLILSRVNFVLPLPTHSTTDSDTFLLPPVP